MRDRLFTDQGANQAADLNLRVLEIDGSLGIDKMARRVDESLGLVAP